MKKLALLLVLFVVVSLALVNSISGEGSKRIVMLERTPAADPRWVKASGKITILPPVPSDPDAWGYNPPLVMYDVNGVPPATSGFVPWVDHDFYTVFMQEGEGGEIVKLQNFNTDFNWIQRNGIVHLWDYKGNEEVLFSEPVQFWICTDYDDGVIDFGGGGFCILTGSD